MHKPKQPVKVKHLGGKETVSGCREEGLFVCDAGVHLQMHAWNTYIINKEAFFPAIAATDSEAYSAFSMLLFLSCTLGSAWHITV